MPTAVQEFFDRLARHELNGALDFVHEDAVFEAQGPESMPMYGRFEGRKGVERFIALFSETFDADALDIHTWSVIDEFFFAYGYLHHRIRGWIFGSEWALVCCVKDGRISAFKMFEDRAALQTAYA